MCVFCLSSVVKVLYIFCMHVYFGFFLLCFLCLISIIVLYIFCTLSYFFVFVFFHLLPAAEGRGREIIKRLPYVCASVRPSIRHVFA